MDAEAPKRWRCTHGHTWEAIEPLIGFRIEAPLSMPAGSVYGLAPGETRRYCGQCIRMWMDEHWGQVREVT